MFEELENKNKDEDVKQKEMPSINNPAMPLNGNLPERKFPSEDAMRPQIQEGGSFDKRIKDLYEKGKKRGKRYSIIGLTFSLVIILIAVPTVYYLFVQVRNISKQVENREKDTLELNKANYEAIVKYEEQKEKCLGEGEATSSAIDLLCCNQLSKVSKFESINNTCLPTVDFVCVNCPDGECGIGEDGCNCPQDCTTENVLVSTSSNENSEDFNQEESRTKPENDSDKDGLLDQDESKYGADPQNPDTDGDGFNDGDEVRNGYNPIGEGTL